MTIQTALLTLGASAVQFPAATSGTGLVRYIRAEPLRSNTHVSYVGPSTVTADGSGTGVIKEIAQPPAATVANDAFVLEDMGGDNRLDPLQLYGHGTAAEKLKITYISA